MNFKLKRWIISLAVVLTGVFVASSAVDLGTLEKQYDNYVNTIEYHEQQKVLLSEEATMKRAFIEKSVEVGLGDDAINLVYDDLTPKIKMCSELWWEHENELRELIPERDRLKIEIEAEKKRIADDKGTYMGSFRITYYTPSASENGGYTTTATGASLVNNIWKCVAVDPSVIPLGSKVYIEGLGTFTAMDTGGAIKRQKIDVLVNYGEANAMGNKYPHYMKVYVKK